MRGRTPLRGRRHSMACGRKSPRRWSWPEISHLGLPPRGRASVPQAVTAGRRLLPGVAGRCSCGHRWGWHGQAQSRPSTASGWQQSHPDLEKPQGLRVYGLIKRVGRTHKYYATAIGRRVMVLVGLKLTCEVQQRANAYVTRTNSQLGISVWLSMTPTSDCLWSAVDRCAGEKMSCKGSVQSEGELDNVRLLAFVGWRASTRVSETPPMPVEPTSNYESSHMKAAPALSFHSAPALIKVLLPRSVIAGRLLTSNIFNVVVSSIM